MEEQSVDKILLDGRKRLEMTGVTAVVGFSEQKLCVAVSGKKVTATGSGIKITAFNKDTGNFAAEGLFDSIKYDEKKQPLLKKIFK